MLLVHIAGFFVHHPHRVIIVAALVEAAVSSFLASDIIFMQLAQISFAESTVSSSVAGEPGTSTVRIQGIFPSSSNFVSNSDYGC